MCVGAGLALLLLNVLYRYGASGDRERDAEDEAREYSRSTATGPTRT